VSIDTVNGLQLKARRVERGLRAADVAEKFAPPVSKQRVSAIEQLHRVRPVLVERYIRAVDAATDG